MNLTGFLLARIAEDEAAQRSESGWGRCNAPTDYHWTTQRVLAECEAKRLIMRGHESVYIGDEYVGEPFILRALALPYADHPDYDESWRP